MRKIPLSGAFLRVLWELESAGGLPEKDRLGLPSSEHEESGPPPIHAATGENYRRLMDDRLRQSQAMFDNRVTRLKPAPGMVAIPLPERPMRVCLDFPRLPDREQILALSKDRTLAPETASLAEWYACRTHDQLIGYLKEGKVSTWGAEIRYATDEDRVACHGWQANAGPITTVYWLHCEPDYSRDEAHGTVPFEEDDGHRPRKYFWKLTEIFVDGDKLNEVMLLDPQISATNSAVVASKIELREENDSWFVSLNNSEIPLGPLRNQEARLRGLRAIKLLRRHAGQRVSVYVLEGLVRSLQHTNQTDPAKIARNEAIQAATAEVAQDLYWHPETEDLDRAHHELEVKIGAIEFPDDPLRGQKWWASRLGHGSVPGKSAESYKAVSQKVRDSISDAIAFIESEPAGAPGTSSSVRQVIARELNRRINCNGGSAIFE